MSPTPPGEPSSETDPSRDDWTPRRRRTLVAALGHLLPWPEPPAGTGESIVAAVADAVRRNLAEPGFAAREPWVLALLDELDDRAQGTGQPLIDQDADTREGLLREIEAGDNAYLSQALRWLLQMALEASLGDPAHGGNPGGGSWQALGLGPEGPRRRLGNAGAQIERDDAELPK